MTHYHVYQNKVHGTHMQLSEETFLRSRYTVLDLLVCFAPTPSFSEKPRPFALKSKPTCISAERLLLSVFVWDDRNVLNHRGIQRSTSFQHQRSIPAVCLALCVSFVLLKELVSSLLSKSLALKIGRHNTSYQSELPIELRSEEPSQFFWLFIFIMSWLEVHYLKCFFFFLCHLRHILTPNGVDATSG